MKFRWDKKYLYGGITAFLVIVCAICFFLLLNRFGEVLGALRFLGDLLMPFIIGLVVAYLLSPVVEFFENKCFFPLGAWCGKTFEGRLPRPGRKKPGKEKKPSRLPRIFSIILTFILTITLVSGLVVMVVPKLIDTVYAVAQSLPGYFVKMERWAIELSASYPEVGAFIEEQFNDVSESVVNWLKTNLLPHMNQLVGTLTSGVVGFASSLMDMFVGLIVAIYVLFSKERFVAQAKKMAYALFPVKGANLILKLTRRADGMFGGFIKGKIIDSSLMGILCFIGMSALPFLHSPYTLLISVLIGVTNIIPFFGPFIGAIPSALLLLMVDPWKCLWFILFILVLQQLDGNVIGPRILGDSTGLSAFWVMFAIMVFGGLFGFVGMIIGVPAFALVYSLVVEYVESRLARRALPVETAAYRDLDHMEADSGEIVKAKRSGPAPK